MNALDGNAERTGARQRAEVDRLSGPRSQEPELEVRRSVFRLTKLFRRFHDGASCRSDDGRYDD